MLSVIKKLSISDRILVQIVPLENIRVGEEYSLWEADTKYIYMKDKSNILPVSGKIRFYISNERIPEIGRNYFIWMKKDDIFYFNLNDDKFSFYRNFLKKKIIGQCFLKNKDLIETNEFNRAILPSIVHHLRKIFVEYAFKRINDKEVASIGLAMWIGDERYLNSKLYETFSKSGVIHILSVSGMHVGFIYIIFNYVLSKSSLSRSRRFLLICMLLVLYTMLCGLGIPVIRASLMFILVEILYFWSYHVHNKNILVLCGLALIFLIFDPFLIYDLSFQLSFSSMVGLLILYPELNNQLINKPLNIMLKKYIIEPIFITLSTSITTLPFILYSFHAFTFISFISNIFIIPLSFIFMLSFLLIIIPFDLIGQVPTIIGSFLLKISEFFSVFSESISFRHVDFGNLDFVFSTVIIFLFSYILLTNDKRYVLTLIIISFVWLFLSTIDAYHHKKSKYFFCENHRGNLNALVKNTHLLYVDFKRDISYNMNNIIAESNYPYRFEKKIMMTSFNKIVFILSDSVFARVRNRFDTIYVITKKWKNYKKLLHLFDQNKEVKIVFLNRNSYYFYKH